MHRPQQIIYEKKYLGEEINHLYFKLLEYFDSLIVKYKNLMNDELYYLIVKITVVDMSLPDLQDIFDSLTTIRLSVNATIY